MRSALFALRLRIQMYYKVQTQGRSHGIVSVASLDGFMFSSFPLFVFRKCYFELSESRYLTFSAW